MPLSIKLCGQKTLSERDRTRLNPWILHLHFPFFISKRSSSVVRYFPGFETEYNPLALQLLLLVYLQVLARSIASGYVRATNLTRVGFFSFQTKTIRRPESFRYLRSIVKQLLRALFN